MCLPRDNILQCFNCCVSCLHLFPKGQQNKLYLTQDISFSRLFKHCNWCYEPNEENFEFMCKKKENFFKTINTFHLFSHRFQSHLTLFQNTSSHNSPHSAQSSSRKSLVFTWKTLPFKIVNFNYQMNTLTPHR